MNRFSYENQSTITYLVYSLSKDDIIDSMSLGMLTNNKIAGLAPAIYTQMDEDRFIRYNVSAKITAKQFLVGSVSRKRLVGILKNIVDGMLCAADYMIDTNSIILDLDYIFVDVTSCEAELICIPVVDGEHSTNDIGNFIKNIMVNTQFDSSENSDYIAKIFNFLNSSPVFSIEEFKRLLIELEDNTNMASKSVEIKQPLVKNNATVITSSQSKQSVVQANLNGLCNSQGAVVENGTQNQLKQPYVNRKKETVPFETTQTSQASEKQISWLYLMQHYNKENAEAYKAQKAAKKNAGKAHASTQVNARQKQASVNSTFAIPGQTQSATQVQSDIQSVTQMGTQPVGQREVIPQQLAYDSRKVSQGQAANFGETTVLDVGGIGETTVLDVGQNPNMLIVPYLIRKKNNEKIFLDKPVFRIGKERSYVDYFIGDNTAISRSHANFITRAGKYFIIDTNSTNHTFVNGTMIQSNVETAISHGDTIRLANEEFKFNIY